MRLFQIVMVLLCASVALAQGPGAAAGFQGTGPLLGVGEAIAPPPMRVKWKYKCSQEDRAGVDGSPVIAGQTVYVADAKGVLHALDLQTGQPRWKFDTQDSFGSTPLVVGEKVFIGDLTGTFYAVSAKDGKKLWTVDTQSGVHSSANILNDSILFGDDGADIFCVSTAGKTLWKLEAGDRVNSAPSIGAGMAFVSGCDAKLRGIDVATGQQKFEAELGSLAPGSAVFAGDRIVVGTDQGRVVCMSADGKKQLWLYDQIGSQAMVYATPAVAQGIVVVGARDRAVHAMDLQSGKPLWQFKTRGDVDGPATISAERVYVGSKDKHLYVLDLKTGARLWDFAATRSIDGGVAIADGLLVFADSGGMVFCLEPDAAALPTTHPAAIATPLPGVDEQALQPPAPRSSHMPVWTAVIAMAIVLGILAIWLVLRKR